MREYVAILEDEPARVAALSACAARLLPGAEVLIFDIAPQMIQWLGEHLGEVTLLSLDHDLPLVEGVGCGRDVVEWLVQQPPTCPVIIHSSNENCAPDMYWALKRADWPVERVYPSPEITWVETAWAQRVEQLIARGWLHR